MLICHQASKLLSVDKLKKLSPDRTCSLCWWDYFPPSCSSMNFSLSGIIETERCTFCVWVDFPYKHRWTSTHHPGGIHNCGRILLNKCTLRLARPQRGKSNVWADFVTYWQILQYIQNIYWMSIDVVDSPGTKFILMWTCNHFANLSQSDFVLLHPDYQLLDLVFADASL